MVEQPYFKEFEGMTRDPVSLEDLVYTRHQLIKDIRARIDNNVSAFLLSLHDAQPDFGAIDRSAASDLPAVRWKCINLQKLKIENAAKHAEQRSLLKALLC